MASSHVRPPSRVRCGRRAAGSGAGRRARHRCIVGDQHHRLAAGVHFADQTKHIGRAFRIEIAGRFVGEQQGGLQHQCTRDRGALHLPAGKLARAMLHPVLQADTFEQMGRPAQRIGIRRAREPQRQQHVLQHRQARQQMEALEHETDAPVAQFARGFIVERLHVDAVEDVATAVGLVEAAEHVEQGRLARARGPRQRDERTARDRQVDPVERMHGLPAHGVAAFDGVEFDHASMRQAGSLRVTCARPFTQQQVPMLPRKSADGSPRASGGSSSKGDTDRAPGNDLGLDARLTPCQK
jgi:hypothetical protein